MKLNKTNPIDLLIFGVTILNIVLAVFLRPLIRLKKPQSKAIVLYGHTLNGNLRAIFDDLKGYKAYFLSPRSAYKKRLISSGEDKKRILSAINPLDILQAARSDAFILSHGTHFFSILRKFSSIKFIDVWHGIPYKGFTENDFKNIHGHDQVWVSSRFMRKMYTEKFGFMKKQVKVTGYGRVDRMVNDQYDKSSIVQKYKIPDASKYVLIAPTWKQDSKNRNILPFNTPQKIFFGELDKLAGQNRAHIVFRTHINSSENFSEEKLKNIAFYPYGEYEIAEEFLFISDVLITDWSSIAFDYLPLRRPTIFLDVEPPFEHGFSLGPEYRFGDIARNFEDLKRLLTANLKDPQGFMARHKNDMKRAVEVAYGNTLDGNSVKRYKDRLDEIL